MGSLKLLAIDTCLSACSAALWEDGVLRAHRFEIRERGHAEAIVPMVEACMAEGGCAYVDLDGLAVSTGPGTYTGLRIGHAAVRGFALAAAKPVVGVTSLQAVERAARQNSPTAPPDTLVLLTTRRADLYVQFFRDGVASREPQALKPAAVAGLLPAQPLLLAGDAATAFADDFGRSNMSLAGGHGLPDAADIAALAAQCVARNGLPPPLEFPAPLYLRAPDVTVSAGNVGLRP